MLKIRLRRMGKRHRPFYRVVVSDSRSVPAAPAVDEIGHYDPMITPPEVRIDLDRVEHWSGQGAQLSPAVKKLVKGVRTGKIARVAEPAQQEAPSAVAAPEAEEAPAEEAPAEEAPAEKAAAEDEVKAEEAAEPEAAEAPAEETEAAEQGEGEDAKAAAAAEEPEAETESEPEAEAAEEAETAEEGEEKK